MPRIIWLELTGKTKNNLKIFTKPNLKGWAMNWKKEKIKLMSSEEDSEKPENKMKTSSIDW